MKTKLTLKRGITLAVFSGMMGISFSQTITDSLTFTGGIQTYTVPCGVTELTISAYGAQGGSGAIGSSGTTGGNGGLGSMATGTLTVTPGDVINIFVGGAGSTPTGGFNGGGNGGSTNAGGGGGATDIRINGTALTDRVLVGGGGGGGGRAGCEGSTGLAGNGGNGGAGGADGTNGGDSQTSGGVAGGGFAGVGTTGGNAGLGCGGFLGSPGGAATTGQGGNGGAGQSCCCFSFPSIPGGGGGGGGFDGGGAGGGGSAGTTGCSGNDKGGGGGGAGGSNYTGGVASGSTTNGVRTGNGVVIITYADPTPIASMTMPATSFCAGDTVVFSAISTNNPTSYTWVVNGDLTIISGQGTDSVYVTSTGTTGTITVGSANSCTTGPDAAANTVTINPLPAVSAMAVSDEFCEGGSTDITASGADFYTWNTSEMTATINVSPTTTTTYTVEGVDVNGCTDETTVTITVNPIPVVSVSAPMSGTVCGGQDITLTGTPAGGTFAVTTGNSAALTGNVFNATTVGAYVVEYSYTDGNGCSSTDTIEFNVNCFLGLDLVSNNGMISMYPNPAQGSFSLKAASAITGKVELIDDNGRVVMVQEVSNMTQKQFDLKNVTPGIYNLRITNGSEIITGKLAVVK